MFVSVQHKKHKGKIFFFNRQKNVTQTPPLSFRKTVENPPAQKVKPYFVFTFFVCRDLLTGVYPSSAGVCYL